MKGQLGRPSVTAAAPGSVAGAPRAGVSRRDDALRHRVEGGQLELRHLIRGTALGGGRRRRVALLRTREADPLHAVDSAQPAEQLGDMRLALGAADQVDGRHGQRRAQRPTTSAALDLRGRRDRSDERRQGDVGRNDAGDLAQAVRPVEAALEQPCDGLDTGVANPRRTPCRGPAQWSSPPPPALRARRGPARPACSRAPLLVSAHAPVIMTATASAASTT